VILRILFMTGWREKSRCLFRNYNARTLKDEYSNLKKQSGCVYKLNASRYRSIWRPKRLESSDSLAWYRVINRVNGATSVQKYTIKIYYCTQALYGTFRETIRINKWSIDHDYLESLDVLLRILNLKIWSNYIKIDETIKPRCDIIFEPNTR